LPFAFTCFGIMLIGVAIISREHSLVYRQEREQASIISNLQHFADVFDNTAEGLYAAKSDGTLLRANAAFTSLFGFESEQRLLNTFHKIHDLFSNPIEADLLLVGSFGFQSQARSSKLKVTPNILVAYSILLNAESIKSICST
jgi:PAS domain-containing protein